MAIVVISSLHSLTSFKKIIFLNLKWTILQLSALWTFNEGMLFSLYFLPMLFPLTAVKIYTVLNDVFLVIIRAFTVDKEYFSRVFRCFKTICLK